ASPRQSGSMPVASGSRLPACPALQPPSSRRTRCSAALDDIPAGLSRSSIPFEVNLAVIVANGAIDDPGEARGLFGRVIEHELEPRRMPQPQPPPDLAAQEAGGAGEAGLHLLLRMLRDEGSVEHPRHPHVGREADTGDGDVADARVLDLARDQLREHALQLRLDLAQAAAALRALLHHCNVRATS